MDRALAMNSGVAFLTFAIGVILGVGVEHWARPSPAAARDREVAMAQEYTAKLKAADTNCDKRCEAVQAVLDDCASEKQKLAFDLDACRSVMRQIGARAPHGN